MMQLPRTNFFLAACLFLFVTACIGPALEELEFIEVVTGDPDLRGLGKVRLSGEVRGFEQGPIPDHGFLWSTSERDPKMGGTDVKTVSLGPFSAGAAFDTTVDLLAEAEKYFVRAYVVFEGSPVYGGVVSFTFNFTVEATDSVIVDNDRAILQGLIVGLQTLGDSITEHGHIISATSANPTLADGKVSTLGRTNDDGVFSSFFPNLSFNTRYAARAYARTAAGEVIYGKSIITFQVRDGWRPVAGPGRVRESIAIGLNGRGYLGLGCGELCDEDTGPLQRFREFTPPGGAGNGSWADLTEFPGIAATGAVVFAVGEAIYIGLGAAPLGQGQFFYTSSFWRFDPAANGGDGQWDRVDAFPGTPRQSAVAFSLNGKGYVGTGLRRGDDGALQYFDDFYEFDPTAGAGSQWRSVASLPLALVPGSPPVQGGRSQAVAFAAGGRGYVGAGDSPWEDLRDFWAYDPVQNRWSPVDFLPGDARRQAVAMTINDRGYVGTGYTNIDNRNTYLNDWWQFDPQAGPGNQWRRKTRFWGSPRSRAAAFVIDGRGYLGAGEGLLIRNNSIEDIIYSDLWEYIPEQ